MHQDFTSGLAAVFAATVPFGSSVEEYLSNVRGASAQGATFAQLPAPRVTPAVLAASPARVAAPATSARSTDTDANYANANRLAAIDAATLPGCEALASLLKADLSVSAGDAALRILRHYQILKGYDRGSEAAPQQGAAGEANAVRVGHASNPSPETYRAEWRASGELQADFETADIYAAYAVAVAQGRVRIYGGGERARTAIPAAPINRVQVLEAARTEWRSSAELQAEFETADTYAHYALAVAQGRVRIYGGNAAEAARQSSSAVLAGGNRGGPPASGAAVPHARALNVVQLQEHARAQWRASADLQRDFPTVESYAKYAVAVAQGRVRIYGAPSER